MNTPLRIRVYPENGRWIAEGINCDIRLAFVSKDRLYEMLRVKAEDVRENPRIHARAVAA